MEVFLAIPARGAMLTENFLVPPSRRINLVRANQLKVPLQTQEAILQLMERDMCDRACQRNHCDQIH